MSTFRNFVSLLCLVMAPVCLAIVECPKKDSRGPARFFGIQDRSMELSISEEQNLTIYECSRSCRREKTCLSYSYSKYYETCKLFAYDRETGPEFFVDDTSYDFYDMVETKTDQEHYTGACRRGHKCQNGGSCRVDCSERGYYCACPEEYRGEYCEEPYFDEAVLVQTIYADMGRGSAGFTFDNMHFIVTSNWQATDSEGNTAESPAIMYRYNNATGLYEYMQEMAGTSRAMKLSAFKLTGKQYVMICNHRDWYGTQATTSYLYVYQNETDSFVSHQEFETFAAYSAPYIRTSGNDFYMLLTNFYYSTYDRDSYMYKWYPRYEKFFWVQNIATKGATVADMFEMDSTVYVAIPFFRGQSESFNVPAEVWKQTDSYDLYRGCYIDGTSRALDGDSFSSSSMTVSLCIEYCRVRGYPHAGLQAQTHCFCGDDVYDEHGSANDCNSVCSGDNSEYCGASWRNSVYSTERSWSQVQTLADTNSGSSGARHYEHDGSHYLVITQAWDGSACDQDTIVFVWDAASENFEIHQKIPFTTSCPFDVDIFQRNHVTYMLSSDVRQQYSISDGSQYESTCRLFKLEGTMWVDYKTFTGMNVFDWSVFERDGELYLFEMGGRDSTGSLYSNCPHYLYRWV